MTHANPERHTKRSLRQEALAVRATLPIPSISASVCQNLAQWDVFQQAEQVLFYFPFRDEVELQSLYHLAPEKRWYLPAVLPSHEMVFRRATASFEAFDLTNGKFGIPEPPAHAETWGENPEYSLLLVPGLMFDRQGYRLGYGKGYYDRFLNLPPVKESAIPKVGIVPCALLHQNLPHDPWDVPMDYLATEHGCQSAINS